MRFVGPEFEGFHASAEEFQRFNVDNRTAGMVRCMTRW
jgi:hypothetical protein